MLYQKYRPRKLDDVVGNEGIVRSLKGLIDDTERPRAYLLHGPTGCGKTTLARILAREFGAIKSDIKEINAADFRGIDTIRDVINKSRYAPMGGDACVWIFDEAQQLVGTAQSAMLKLLEDVYETSYFILCTTDPHRLLPTIRGRCTKFEVKPLENKQMYLLLKKIATAEKRTLEKDVYKKIVLNTEGRPRNAIQLLESVLSVEDRTELQLEVAGHSEELEAQVIELCRVLLNGKHWQSVKQILSGIKKEEPERIRRAVLGYCQTVLLRDENDRAAEIIEVFSENTYNSGFAGIVYYCYCVTKNK